MSKTCVLCDGTFEGFGNNPFPLAEEGVCCDWCNDGKVIPERIRRMKE